MNKRQKAIIVKNIELNTRLYNAFKKYLDKQELDIEFILYEDEPRYFQRVWNPFYKSFLRKMKGGRK